MSGTTYPACSKCNASACPMSRVECPYRKDALVGPAHKTPRKVKTAESLEPIAAKYVAQ